MITPTQAFTAIHNFIKEQQDLIKGIYTEYDPVITTPSVLLEVPQIQNISPLNLSANSILVTYRFHIQIGSQELNPWNATGTVSDIASTLRIRFLKEFNKFNEGSFHDFTNLKFMGMPIVGIESKNETVMMVIARQGIEFALEEDAELEGVLVQQLHNRYDEWAKEPQLQLIREEIYDAEDIG